MLKKYSPNAFTCHAFVYGYISRTVQVSHLLDAFIFKELKKFVVLQIQNTDFQLDQRQNI